MAEPSSCATFPKLNASLPSVPKRFGPIWSVPMQVETASLPRLIASCTTGVAKSTSQVVKMMFAPPSSSSSAHDFALVGLLFCVSQVLIWNVTVPFLIPLMCAASIFAAARAGLSKGAIWPDES
jgi:hypothetical protein